MLFLLFCAAMAISLVYTRSEQGAMKVARFETFEVLLFFAPLLLLKKKRDVRQLFIAFVLLGIVLSGQVIIDLLHPSKLVLSGNEDPTKIGIKRIAGCALLFCLYGKLGESVAIKYACVVIFLFGLGRMPYTYRFRLSADQPFGYRMCGARRNWHAFRAQAGCYRRSSRRSRAIPTLLWLVNLPAAQGKLRWKVAELLSLASVQVFRPAQLLSP